MFNKPNDQIEEIKHDTSLDPQGETPLAQLDGSRCQIEIMNYLNQLLPNNWDDLSIEDRRAFFSIKDPRERKGTNRREKICAVEILSELFGEKIDEKTKYKTRPINQILTSLDIIDASKADQRVSFGAYGQQHPFYIKWPEETNETQDDASLFTSEILKAQPLTVEALAERQIYYKEYAIEGGSKVVENIADQFDELAMAYFIAAKKIRKQSRKDWPIHRFKVRILRDPIEVRIETPSKLAR